METYDITIDGHTFTVTDGKGEGHARAAAAALEKRLEEIRVGTGVVNPLRVALMAALCAEAELLGRQRTVTSRVAGDVRRQETAM